MISLIIVLITAAIIAIALRTETEFNLVRSIIIGLTSAPFMVISVLVNMLNFISNLGLRLGLGLGGTNVEELLQSYLTRQLKKGKIQMRGDESENKPEEDDLH